VNETIVLTVDELRVIARLIDAPLPAALVDDGLGDEPTADGIDRAAIRGLRARGLLAGLVLDRRLAPIADALARATSAVEVERDAAGAGSRCVVLDGPATVVLTETEPGLWSTAVADGPVAVLVAAMVELDRLDGPPGAGEPFEVSSAVHAEADDLLVAGDTDGARRRLVAGGVADPAARAWIDAIAGRRDAVAIRCDDGELCWIVDRDDRCWEVDIALDRDASVCTPARGADLRGRAARLLELEPSWR
jgi:hypothetical protein